MYPTHLPSVSTSLAQHDFLAPEVSPQGNSGGRLRPQQAKAHLREWQNHKTRQRPRNNRNRRPHPRLQRYSSTNLAKQPSKHIQLIKSPGYPENSPTTSDYFKDELHTKDQYSISFSFTPKEDISGNDLVFGNDFDNPLRDRLPVGFNAALRLVKWTIDPSIDGDAYADKPYLFSPALATWNQFRIGDRNKLDGQGHPEEYVLREGGDGEGEKIREELGIPGTADARRKHFHNVEHLKRFTFEAGRTYMADFGNQFISFSGELGFGRCLLSEVLDADFPCLDMSIRLPGFHIPVVDMVDDQHRDLRYVLKDVKTGRVYLTVLFSLLDETSPPPKEHAVEPGSKEDDVD